MGAGGADDPVPAVCMGVGIRSVRIRDRGERRVSAVFLIGYGLMRFIAEYFREPDDFLGLLALNMSMGQWLCVPMIAFGLWLYVSARPAPVAGALRG